MTKEAPQEELEEVLLAMVEPILNFLQIHRKMIFRDASIIVENVLSKRPEPFDPVDVVLRPTLNETLGMVDGVMVAIASQRLIASKSLRVVDGTFAGGGLNVGHEGIRRHVLDHFRIDSAIRSSSPKTTLLPAAPRPRRPFRRPPK